MESSPSDLDKLSSTDGVSRRAFLERAAAGVFAGALQARARTDYGAKSKRVLTDTQCFSR